MQGATVGGGEIDPLNKPQAVAFLTPTGVESTSLWIRVYILALPQTLSAWLPLSGPQFTPL